MASYNRIIIVGNLTRNPELNQTLADTPICKFGIATNRKWTDKAGNKQEEVMFVDCVLFGKSAETFNEFMGVGKPVLIEGRLTFNTWESKDGQKRSKHEVNVDNFTFLGDGGGGGNKEMSKSRNVETKPVPPADDGIQF